MFHTKTEKKKGQESANKFMIIFWLIFQNYKFYINREKNVLPCDVNMYFLYFEIILKITRKIHYTNNKGLIFLKKNNNAVIMLLKNLPEIFIKILTFLPKTGGIFFIFFRFMITFFKRQFDFYNFVIDNVNIKKSLVYLWFFTKIEKKIYTNNHEKTRLGEFGFFSICKMKKNTQLEAVFFEFMSLKKKKFFKYFRTKDILFFLNRIKQSKRCAKKKKGRVILLVGVCNFSIYLMSINLNKKINFSNLLTLVLLFSEKFHQLISHNKIDYLFVKNKGNVNTKKLCTEYETINFDLKKLSFLLMLLYLIIN